LNLCNFARVFGKRYAMPSAATTRRIAVSKADQSNPELSPEEPAVSAARFRVTASEARMSTIRRIWITKVLKLSSMPIDRAPAVAAVREETEPRGARRKEGKDFTARSAHPRTPVPATDR
jgi:hypothetical protein